VASEEILQQPKTSKATGYGNAQRDIYCGIDSFSTGPQEKSSVSLGFCRLMSFEKHMMLFLERDMSASKRQQRQQPHGTIGPDRQTWWLNRLPGVTYAIG